MNYVIGRIASNGRLSCYRVHNEDIFFADCAEDLKPLLDRANKEDDRWGKWSIIELKLNEIREIT